ncbi:hypothetical protein C6P45_005503 [Maudiozyma exigua]|uniref:Uncharacterized protein n=1 Tax=Maudiozyma exigua TaxID=34358 RepID=A0A9P7BA52_MAUEX|nr:hypothetical protein C6P45_005503 [Kazachstania exigua]
MSMDSVTNQNDRIGNTTLPKKRIYPLRMETLPDEPSGKEVNSDANVATSTQNPQKRQSNNDIPNSQDSSVTNTDGFENDQDFRFKRHKLPKGKGMQSLGERLDNLQGMKRAKWMDNFDSSIRNTHDRNSRDRGKSSRDNNMNININNTDMPSSRPNLNMDQIPYLGASQWQQTQPQQPMYYIPVPTSPMYNSQVPMGSIPPQYMSQGIPILPNSSIQPFYPSQSIPSSSQLLPPPQLNPTNLQYAQNTRHNRRSLAEQRGRRLSIMSNRDQTMISPHRDVPENQFYRYLGHMPGDTDLQLRQLYSWCAIRSFERMRHDFKSQEKFSDALPQNFIENKNITLSIIQNFVDDLRRGHIDIDWNAEDRTDIERYKEKPRDPLSNEQEESEDTILKNLFREDDDEQDGDDDHSNEVQQENRKYDNEVESNDTRSESFYYTGINVKKIPKRNDKRTNKDDIEMVSQSQRKTNVIRKKEIPLLPNSKNIKNEQNLMILTEKVENLKKELQNWIDILDNHNIQEDIRNDLKSLQTDVDTESVERELEEKSTLSHLLSTEDLEKDLVKRMNKLQVHTHLIKSHSDLLKTSTSDRIKQLSNEFKRRENPRGKTVDSKRLLRGLSESLTKL